jgi:hypothetical protein
MEKMVLTKPKKSKVVGIRVSFRESEFLDRFAKDTHQSIAGLLRPVIRERIAELKAMSVS